MKRIIKYSTCLFFLSIMHVYIYAQDVHYSQFMNAHVFLNPSQTGLYDGSWRFSNSYRQQWTAIHPPFISNALAYDQQIIEKADKLSAGGLLIYDKSGDLKFTVAKILISAAYHKQLNEKMTLSAGIQPVLSIKSYSTEKLSFPDQFNNGTGVFDPNLSTADNFGNQQATNMNINTGVTFRKTGLRYSPEAGIALFNAIPTKESFSGFDIKAQKRLGINAACFVLLNPKFFIKPNIQYLRQEKASSLVVGSHVGHYVKPNTSGLRWVYLATYFRSGLDRNSDAIVPMIGCRIKKFDLGISYDINISSLKQATNNRGAIEFSLIYTNWKDLLNKITPNCDRM